MYLIDIMFEDSSAKEPNHEKPPYEKGAERKSYLLDTEEIARCIEQGRPFYDSMYKYGIRNTLNRIEFSRSWMSQQLFILAINDCNLDELINQARFLGVPVSMIIEGSLNNGPKTKYAVFLFNVPVSDLRMRYVVIASLRKLYITEKFKDFEKAINKTFNSFGLIQFNDTEVLHVDSNAYVDTLHLIETTCCKLHVEGDSHGDRDLKRYLKSIYLLANNRGALLKIGDPQSYEMKNLKTEPTGFYYDIISEETLGRLYFSITKADFIKIVIEECQPENQPLEQMDLEAQTNSVKWDAHEDIERLIATHNGCMHLKEIIDGERLANISELRWIAFELRNQKGMQSEISKRLTDTEQYDNVTLTMFKRFMERYRRIVIDKSAIPCEPYCERCESCQDRQGYVVKQMTDLLPLKKGSIRKLLTINREVVLKDELRERIADDFESDLTLNKETLYIYKCFVGLGKTKMYVDKAIEFINSNKSVIIAFPNHALKEDVMNRIMNGIQSKSMKKKIINVPSLPSINCELDRTIEQLFKVGATKQVKEIIKIYIKGNIMNKPKAEWTTADKQLIEYQRIPKSLRRKNFINGKVVLCTHERLFQLNELVADYWIIDEDITNSMLKQGSVPLCELEKLKEHLLLSEGDQNGSVIEIIEQLQNAELDRIYEPQHDVKAWSVVNQILMSNRGEFNTAISELLFNCSAYVKAVKMGSGSEVETIHYIVRRSLNLNGKVFVLSATANKAIYEKLFGEHIIFRDYGVPNLEAEFRQMYKYSYSRYWAKNNVASIGRLEDIILEKEDFDEEKRYLAALGFEREDFQFKDHFLVITHLSIEDEFKRLGYNNTMHFGKTTGFDDFKGYHLIVFGTPHVNPMSYALINKVLFPEDNLTAIPRIQSNVLVSRNGYQFYFTTTPDECNFREIQFWMIESDLIQAIGRARPIDHNCKIYVWTDLPLPDLDLNFERWDEGLLTN